MHFMKRPRRQNQHLPQETKNEPDGPVALLELGDAVALVLDRAHVLVAEDEALLDLEPAVVGMQVGAADRRAVDAQQDVGGLLDRRLRDLLDPHVPRPVEGERLSWLPWSSLPAGMNFPGDNHTKPPDCPRDPSPVRARRRHPLARRARTVLARSERASLPAGASAVAGPSGCGKSTLLRLLNRLADPDSGAISYRGRSVDRVRRCWSCAARSAWCHSCPRCWTAPSPTTSLFAARLAGHDTGRRPRMLEPGRASDASFADRDAGQALGRRAAARDAGARTRARAVGAAARRADLGAGRGGARLPSRRRCSTCGRRSTSRSCW